MAQRFLVVLMEILEAKLFMEWLLLVVALLVVDLPLEAVLHLLSVAVVVGEVLIQVLSAQVLLVL